MNTQPQAAVHSPGTHKGPHPGMLAVLYMVLFCAGLYPVTLFYKLPYWPGPWEPASTIVPFFQTQGARVVLCLFLQLGAMVCLGLFTATVVSRLHFLGARAAASTLRSSVDSGSSLTPWRARWRHGRWCIRVSRRIRAS